MAARAGSRAEVRGDFDPILVDGPPHVHLSARAARVAADGVVSPLQAEDHGARGLVALQEVDRPRIGSRWCEVGSR